MQDLKFTDPPPNNAGWAVVGTCKMQFADISGILEWCRTKAQALAEVRRLSEDNRFSGLKAVFV